MDVAETVALFERLKVALSAKDRALANVLVTALLDGRPPLGNRWKSLAAIAKQNGEFGLANRAMDYYLADVGSHALARYERAAILAQTGHLNDAEAIMRSLPATIPTAADHAYIRGTIAMNVGRFADARDQLRRAVAANPLSGRSWLALAMVGMIEQVDADAIDLARQSMETDHVPALERAAYYFALGKLGAEREDIGAAIDAFDKGAALMRVERPYDRNRDILSAAHAREGWSIETIAAMSDGLSTSTPSRPIFVTGLPRSGTTLVEQILVSHSAVDGGEELGLFRLLEQEIRGKRSVDYLAYLDRDGSPDKLRRFYLHLLAERFTGTGRVVDKTLNASRYIGLIAGLFPDAPIVWVRRDPIDCAWSAYRTYFLKGLDWSWSLSDIAAHFKLEDELFAHWTGLLGERILVVEYAALIADPEAEIRRITAHCGLALELGQYEPHKADRPVTTASAAQVREPINAKGIGSAEPYREFLGPFIDAYARNS